MDAQYTKLIQKIHDHPGQLVLVTAGAGSQAIAWLLSVAGASRTLLEAIIPYHENAFNHFLNHQPDQYVARRTGGLLAGQALQRARRLSPEAEPLYGLACTATIVTDRLKKGPHRAHITSWATTTIHHHTLHLAKGKRVRQEEEWLVSQLILNAISQAYQLDHQLVLPLTARDGYQTVTYDIEQAVIQLLQQQQTHTIIEESGRVSPAKEILSTAILSGSFNPLHEGHIELAETAARILEQPIAFELPLLNADKPPLARQDALRRIAQFAGRYPVIASTAATFVEKARLFPEVTFIVGYDTAVRILQPRFYNDSEADMITALDEIRQQGNNFLVAGRVNAQGEFQPATTLSVPSGYQDLFQPIPASRFRADISSTEIRQRNRS